jgi:hypothetical protein
VIHRRSADANRRPSPAGSFSLRSVSFFAILFLVAVVPCVWSVSDEITRRIVPRGRGASRVRCMAARRDPSSDLQAIVTAGKEKDPAAQVCVREEASDSIWVLEY